MAERFVLTLVAARKLLTVINDVGGEKMLTRRSMTPSMSATTMPGLSRDIAHLQSSVVKITAKPLDETRNVGT